MSQRIFPGGDLKQRKQEIARKKAESKALKKQKKRDREQEQKSKNKELAMKIGPMARLMIVRRGLESFLVGVLLSIAIGSFHWGAQQIDVKAKPKTKISYSAAFKRAYDIRNLGDKDNALYPIAALLMLAGAAAYGRKSMRDGKAQAKDVIETLEGYSKLHNTALKDMNEHNKTNVERHLRILDSGLYKDLAIAQNYHLSQITPEDKMTAICRAIVAKYAAEHRELFDGLMYSEDTGFTRDFATTVAKAHLKSHPEDYNKLVSEFAINTLPKSLVKKYGEKQR